MSNRGARLIASAIVASGGGMTLALASLARSPQYHGGDAGDIAGLLLLLIGGCLCLIDWVAAWREDQRKLSSQNETSDTRFTSKVQG